MFGILWPCSLASFSTFCHLTWMKILLPLSFNLKTLSGLSQMTSQKGYHKIVLKPFSYLRHAIIGHDKNYTKFSHRIIHLLIQKTWRHLWTTFNTDWRKGQVRKWNIDLKKCWLKIIIRLRIIIELQSNQEIILNLTLLRCTCSTFTWHWKVELILSWIVT